MANLEVTNPTQEDYDKLLADFRLQQRDLIEAEEKLLWQQQECQRMRARTGELILKDIMQEREIRLLKER